MFPCYAATSGEGYWTCDTPGGCPDCRALAREINDTEQLATWDEYDPTPCCPDPECPRNPCTFPGYVPFN